MATKNMVIQIKTDKSLEEVKIAARETFRTLGGIIRETAYGFDIEGGNAGINFSFVANIRAAVSVTLLNPGSYQVAAVIVWNPNIWVWICLLVGWFVLGLAWIISALYLFVDPAPVYYRTLSQVEHNLNTKTITPPTAPIQADGDITQKMKKLQEMRENNLITEKEFESKKAELLAKL